MRAAFIPWAESRLYSTFARTGGYCLLVDLSLKVLVRSTGNGQRAIARDMRGIFESIDKVWQVNVLISL